MPFSKELIENNKAVNKSVYWLRHNRISVISEIGQNMFLKNCTKGKCCFIGGKGTFNNTEIGNYTCIAPSCLIGGMEHSYWKASISPKLSDECVSDRVTHIGHDVRYLVL